MRFSNRIEINKGTVKFSHCGDYLAFGFKSDLKILDVASARIVGGFTCTHEIKSVDWLCDSDHILCVLNTVPKVQAFSLSDPEWMCVIEEAGAGLETAVWSPRGYHILTLAQFNARISVWSLTGRSVAFIDNPILKSKSELSFSPDGNFLAVLVGPIDRYKILIFSTSSWVLRQEISCTCDAKIPSNPLWSPTNMHLVIWETIDLTSALLEVYSVEKSELIGTFKKSGKHGLQRISVVSWVANGQFLLVGSHDECIYVLNYITWNVLTVLEHSQVITNEDCQVYEECESWDIKVIEQRPVTVSKVNLLVRSSVLPRVRSIRCDCSGRYAGVVCASMPAVVWIWDLEKFSLLAVVILRQVVTDLKWSLCGSDLLICSNSRNVLIWKADSPGKVKFVSLVDLDMCVRGCVWRPWGREFSVVGSSSMYLVYDVN